MKSNTIQKLDRIETTARIAGTFYDTVTMLAEFMGVTNIPPDPDNLLVSNLPILIDLLNEDIIPKSEGVAVATSNMSELMAYWAGAPETFRFIVGNAVAVTGGNRLITIKEACVILRYPKIGVVKSVDEALKCLADGYKPKPRDYTYVNDLIKRGDLDAFVDKRLNPTQGRFLNSGQVLLYADSKLFYKGG